MFSLVHRRNNQPEIGYSFISSTYFIFFMLTFFLMIIVLPGKTMAQLGTISGYVYKYSNNSPVQGVLVTAFDEMSEQRGSSTTNSSGYYKITSLPTGSDTDFYRVCARKDGYVTECYQEPNPSDPNGCSGRNCGFFWITDPNETQGSLVDLKKTSNATKINFYILRGGNIEGNIYGANKDFSYRVLLEGNIQYKKSKSVPIEFLLNKENNKFFNSSVIPPGQYILIAKDSSPTYPYYYTVYYDGKNGTYKLNNAKILTYPIDQSIKFTANFIIKRGGYIKGRVLEKFKGDFVGIPEAKVSLREKSLGLEQSTKTKEIYEDPNTGIIYRGLFAISGLPPGTYIMQIDDTFIQDEEDKIYLPEYYNNAYFADQATPITISETDINDPDYQGIYIEVILQHSPVVKGWTIKQDPDMCGSNQYDPLKALKGIKVVVTPKFQTVSAKGVSEVPRDTETGTDGRYIFPKSTKFMPGLYDIEVKDPTCSYFFSALQDITLEPNKEYNFNFCLENVPPGEGKMSISGHVFRNENPDLPLSGVDVAAVHKKLVGSYEFFYSTTNSKGEYLFDDLNCGEYNLAAGGKYEDLIRELYKDVCILDPNEFDEGEDYAVINAAATNIYIYPGKNLTGLDIGLSSYKYIFRSGLNLFGYPGLPVEKYNDTYEFCSKLGSKMHNFQWKDPETGQWYVIDSSNLGNNPKQIRTGQGYMIYMKNQAGPIFFPAFKTMPPKFYQLTPGKNFIAYPSSLHRPIKKSSDLLTALGTPEEVANVQSFDNTSGKWKSTVWLWGKPGADDFHIVQGGGYLVETRVYQTIETDSPNI